MPLAAARRRGIAERLIAVFESWGYARIITPAFECADVLELGLGADGRASAVRIYVGSETSLDMSAAWELHGNIYAPTAVLNTSGGAVFDGAVFVKSLAASAPLSFGYDKRVLEVPDNCAPPGGCHDCRDCRGQACVGGQCGACTDSSQCCAPLVCLAGACVPEAPPR